VRAKPLRKENTEPPRSSKIDHGVVKGASLSASVLRLAELDLLGVSVLHLRTKFVETVEQSSPFKRHRCTDDGAAYCGGGLEKCSAGYKLIPGDNATVSEIEPRLLKPGRLSS